MEDRPKIIFAPKEHFEPTEVQLAILRAVAEQQSCHIGDIVTRLHPACSESSIRSGVRTLMSKGCLDGGKSAREVLLRLTSRGRILIQPKNAS